MPIDPFTLAVARQLLSPADNHLANNSTRAETKPTGTCLRGRRSLDMVVPLPASGQARTRGRRLACLGAALQGPHGSNRARETAQAPPIQPSAPRGRCSTGRRWESANDRRRLPCHPRAHLRIQKCRYPSGDMLSCVECHNANPKDRQASTCQTNTSPPVPLPHAFSCSTQSCTACAFGSWAHAGEHPEPDESGREARHTPAQEPRRVLPEPWF